MKIGPIFLVFPLIDAGPGLVCCDSIYRAEGGKTEAEVPGKSVKITKKGDGTGWRTSTALRDLYNWVNFFFAGKLRPFSPLRATAGACRASTEIIFALLVGKVVGEQHYGLS
jgi:hypothetical protein